MQAIRETNFQFPGQTGFYSGKVRDVYYFGDIMAMVATDRISAFDVILPRSHSRQRAGIESDRSL
jgi:phosphoribosylaminoimidazole-succinocarboxamide synthase